MSLNSEKTQGLYTIGFSKNFAKEIVLHCLKDVKESDLELSNITIILPNRRLCRTVQEEFIKSSDGKILILPKLLPIGCVEEEEILLSDVEQSLDIPKAIDPIKRQVLLSKLIKKTDENMSFSESLGLASDLASFIDKVHLEELDYKDLEKIVPEEFAIHWQKTLEFLKIITEFWPKILAEYNLIDPAKRQVLLLDAQKNIFEQKPSNNKIILAGIVSAYPAVIRLIKSILKHENKMLVFYGLDKELDEQSYQSLDETHPQYSMKQILKELGLDRKDVKNWEENQKQNPKEVFVREIMRPAQTTDKWQDIKSIDKKCLKNVKLIDCPSPTEESTLISIIMRENLEKKEKTVSLVTTDRNLARRVSAELKQWGVEVDDSAGVPLSLTNVGIYLSLILDMVINNFSPVEFLSCMKHPLASAGMETVKFRNLIRKIEKKALRGVRPEEGLRGIKEKLEDDVLIETVEKLEELTKEFTEFSKEGESFSFKEFLVSHISLAEKLAQTNEKQGKDILWAKEDGNKMALFVSDLLENIDDLEDITIVDYQSFLANLMLNITVRPNYGTHPRLSILGPLEARLQRPDIIILSSLNEGMFPKAVDNGAWLSRPMKKEFGMSLPEKSIGLAGHDFSHIFCNEELFLTRPTKKDGSPTVPSRWLLRMDTVIKACGLEKEFEHLDFKGRFLEHLAQEFYIPKEKGQRISPPAPKPPLYARPTRLSVTQIEKLMRDPYSVYADKILKLKKLDEIDADFSALEYGSIIHKVLEEFVKKYDKKELPQDIDNELLCLGRKVFDNEKIPEILKVFWWEKFVQIAKWFAKHEKERRKENITKIFTEDWGAYKFLSKGREFEIFAKADRLELLDDGNSVGVVDYKTGTPPTKKEIAAGYSPQLPLEGAIAQKGGFKGIEKGAKVSFLSYWKLSGGEIGGSESKIYDLEPKKPINKTNKKEHFYSFLSQEEEEYSKTKEFIKQEPKEDKIFAAQYKTADDACKEALEGLQKLIDAYFDEKTPYNATPYVEQALKYSDYNHLARNKEWSLQEDE